MTVPARAYTNNATVRAGVYGGGGTTRAKTAVGITVIDAPEFAGPYEYTPTDDAQVVGISGYRAAQDIRINPIPSNYGKITWTGSCLLIT